MATRVMTVNDVLDGHVGLDLECFDRSLEHWNQAATWKETYAGLADGLFCFGQDLFGMQFAVIDNARLVSFDPETTRQTDLGASLEDWAAWLLAEPECAPPAGAPLPCGSSEMTASRQLLVKHPHKRQFWHAKFATLIGGRSAAHSTGSCRYPSQ